MVARQPDSGGVQKERQSESTSPREEERDAGRLGMLDREDSHPPSLG